MRRKSRQQLENELWGAEFQARHYKTWALQASEHSRKLEELLFEARKRIWELQHEKAA